jgi:hypothetical protein
MLTHTRTLRRVLVLSVLMLACTTGPPLGRQEAGSESCIIGAPDEPLIWAIDIVHNFDRSDVTLEAATLRDSDHMVIGEAFVLPIVNTTLIGLRRGFPEDVVGTALWADRQPIAGTIVHPGEELNLLVEVALHGATRGSFQGLSVTYSSLNMRYRWNGGSSLEVGPSCDMST